VGDNTLSLCKDGRRARSNSCVVSGQTLLYSPYAEIKQKTIKFHPEHPPIATRRPSRHGKRNLATTVGNRTVVVLRVIASDTQTNYTAAELYHRVFNTSTLSLRTGYDACSYGQLILRPTTHALAVNGVVNVTINMVATGADSDDVENAVTTAATTILGDLPSQFDHVMIAMPPGVLKNGGSFTSSYAHVNGYLSVYPSPRIGFVSTTRHEIGHNLNLRHSGEGTAEYGDQSCIMGYTYSEPNFPKMCFNGAKSFNFGWYSSRTETLKIFTTNTSTFTMEYTLIGTADYQNPNNDASSLVVVKLETGSPDYYVYFNRKIGINSEVQEYGNYVMVVSQGDNPSQSWIVATFNTAGNYTIANAGGSKFDITVAVSSINLLSNPAKATVSVTRMRSDKTVPLTDDTLPGTLSQWIQNRTVALVAFGNITEWNTENVTNLEWLFEDLTSFNDDISFWNVGRVTSLYAAFYNASAFNKDLSKWNVARVTNMRWTFGYASTFNSNIGYWNISSVTEVSYMFYMASKFNQSLCWNITGKASTSWNKYSSGSLAPASCVNGSPTRSPTVSRTAKPTRKPSIGQSRAPTISPRPSSTPSSRQPTTKRTVIASNNELQSAVSLWISDRTLAINTYGHISNWDTSRITNLDDLFDSQTTFNDDISGWNVGRVTSMYATFYNASLFNVSLSSWNVSSTTDLSWAFAHATNFNGNVSGWNVAKTRTLSTCFYYAKAFNQDLSQWDVSSVTDLSWTFAHAEKFNGNISSWNVTKTRDMNSCFYYAMAFNRDLSMWDVSSVTDINWIFAKASVFNQDLSLWKVGKVTDMNHAFYYAQNFNSAISVWNVGSVADFSSMFYAATKFNQSLCWNVTGKVTTSMFTSSSGSTAPASCFIVGAPTKKPTSKPSRNPSFLKTKKPTKRYVHIDNI
jgi:surface protein